VSSLLEWCRPEGQGNQLYPGRESGLRCPAGRSLFLSHLHTETEVDIMSVYENVEDDVRNREDMTGEWRKIT
jgi:hypothetical protein